ncbi:hypothetical protein EX30DRAFT_241924 [Ascodesmis nigricans]|uniref:Protein kinase domain-containing protein n=1 Tax=Ascodesmis nigricans TaxID=341454 RepID=A0A4S2MYX4_9PEZI|nr:hypothetical protein EX30DRAFT_241924 [Ascodesmis nigricans]
MDNQPSSYSSDPSTIIILDSFVNRKPTYESYYRMIISHEIRYLTIAPGLLDAEILKSTPHLLSSLPPLPPGNWKEAKLLPHGIYETRSHELPEIRTAWHRSRFDILTLDFETSENMSPTVCSYPVKHDAIGGPLIAKYGRSKTEIERVDAESRMWLRISGGGIGAEFVGHIIRHGRVIGFLVRDVKAMRGRVPESGCREDYVKCRDTLMCLHGEGIRLGKPGALRRENFVVDRDGKAVVMDFEDAAFVKDVRELEMEMEMLPWLFSIRQDSSG